MQADWEKCDIRALIQNALREDEQAFTPEADWVSRVMNRCLHIIYTADAEIGINLTGGLQR